jgi:ribonuclease P protein component
MDRLTRRKEFQAVARGRRVHCSLFSLQVASRPAEATATSQPAGAAPPARAGLTVTRKTGHATERNRIRRRLREAMRLEEGEAALGAPGTDYVVMARRELLAAPFASIRTELRRAFERAHRPKPAKA